MNLELSKDEIDIIKMMLSKEEVETRVEIHHANRSFEFRDYLKDRQKMIHNLLGKISHLES